MAYQPVVPLSGVAGWRLLNRTMEKQEATFQSSADIKRDVDYFTENIASVKTVEDLLGDQRLLKVALGAFGLSGDISKKGFIRKVLEEGTEDNKALAMRLTDTSYRKLASVFGFGDKSGVRTGTSGFATLITSAYQTRAFEVAVGESNDDMRLALNFKREIVSLAAGEGGSWYSILGSKPLRAVIEKAFNLPSSFAQIDIDQQRAVLMEKARSVLGSDKLTVFQDAEVVEKVITRFLARSQIESGATDTSSPAAAALAMLQGSSSGSSGLMNLLAARN